MPDPQTIPSTAELHMSLVQATKAMLIALIVGPAAAAPPFKAGDIVRLRSGGPDMTVTGGAGGNARCAWWTGDSYSKAAFSYASLVSA